MAALIIMAGFGDERKAFVEALNKTLAEAGENKVKILPLLAAAKGTKHVIITIPRRHQIDPDGFLETLRKAHHGVEFTGLGVEMNQEEGEEEYPHLSVH